MTSSLVTSSGTLNFPDLVNIIWPTEAAAAAAVAVADAAAGDAAAAVALNLRGHSNIK